MVLYQLLYNFRYPYRLPLSIDDITCHSKCFSSQLEKFIANVMLNPKTKWYIPFQKEVSFLGYNISEMGVGVCPKKIQTIEISQRLDMHAQETRESLYFASCYRSYEYQFAKIANPLNDIAYNGITISKKLSQMVPY